MGLARYYKFILFTSLMWVSIPGPSVWAADAFVQTLSEGACWFEQSEVTKIASFNDGQSLLMSRDEIESELETLLKIEKKQIPISSDLSLHCGGYGSSLVIKTVIENRPACLWLKFNQGKFSIRSLGGLENIKNEICDGYKWGELIVGIKSLEQKSLLESKSFLPMIDSVSVVSGLTLKINLHADYYGKELIVLEELKKHLSLRYIELNHFQHPVGEAATLK